MAQPESLSKQVHLSCVVMGKLFMWWQAVNAFFQHPGQRSYRRENRCRDICEWEYQSHLNKDYTCVCILHGETRTTYVMSWLPWHVFSRPHYYPNSLPFFNWLTVTHHPYVSCHLTHPTPNYIVFTLSILSFATFSFPFMQLSISPVDVLSLSFLTCHPTLTCICSTDLPTHSHTPVL